MFIEWLGTHLSEEERNKISVDDIDKLLRTNSYLC